MSFELRTSNFTFGVDVGGTTTRVGLVSGDGGLIQSDRFETPRSASSFFDRMAAHVSAWSDQVEPTTPIGVALPGPVDRARGVLVRSVNLPFLEEIPLESELAGRLGRRVVLMTDSEAAAWGEFSICAPRSARFVHLRFGTGIACGMVVNGLLSPTDPTRRTHRPDLVVDRRPEAAACACGLRGCLELFASGPALEVLARRMQMRKDLVALQADFVKERQEAKTLVSGVAGWIVRGIRNVLDPLLDGRGTETKSDEATERRSDGAMQGSEPPRSWSGFSPQRDSSMVSLGGGVLAVLPVLFDAVCERWRRQVDDICRGVAIERGRLGDDAGIVGAALLAPSC